MRKAIKELTEEELKNICSKNHCNTCPLGVRFGSDPQAQPMCYSVCKRVVDKLQDRKINV